MKEIFPQVITVLVALAIVVYAFLLGLCGNAGFPTCAEHRRNLIASGVNPLVPAILFAGTALAGVAWFMRKQRCITDSNLPRTPKLFRHLVARASGSSSGVSACGEICLGGPVWARTRISRL